MFNHMKLNETDKTILNDFFLRRSFFDNFIVENNLRLKTCPGCGYPTLSERGEYEICIVCDWEDDRQDDNTSDKIWNGPNGNLSLTENRIYIGRILDDGKSNSLRLDNIYAENILKTIKHFDDKRGTIYKTITGNETLQHPMWTELEQIEKDLQSAINKINKL